VRFFRIERASTSADGEPELVGQFSLDPYARHGKRPGAGRRPDAVKAELKTLMDTCVPVNVRERILRKQVEKAVDGELEAAKFLFAYLYGKPVDRKDITSDGEAIGVFGYEIIVPGTRDKEPDDQ
jgi:hypothetical protein